MTKHTHSNFGKILRNLLGLGLGLLFGSIAYILLSVNLSTLFPLPEGVDTGNIESLRKHIAEFSYQNFIPPFLGHAVGTLLGAFICTIVAVSRKAALSLIIGLFFLGIGIFMVVQLPKTPLWFILIDLCLAYLPMATLGTFLGRKTLKLVNRN
ncbi:MAG: hypothetical protein LRY27_01660 [Chitinophagales bacterium]|nr:hypothetical protein [Chitinophagales bacterium]